MVLLCTSQAVPVLEKIQLNAFCCFCIGNLCKIYKQKSPEQKSHFFLLKIFRTGLEEDEE